MCKTLAPCFSSTFDCFGSIRQSFAIGKDTFGTIIFSANPKSGPWHELVGRHTCEDEQTAQWLAKHRISFDEALAICNS